MHVPFRTSVKLPHSAAHLAFVALGLGFRPAFGLAWGDRHGGAAGLAPLQGFQLFRRRQVVAGFLLQRDRAFDGCRRRGRWGRGAAIAVTLPEPRASTSTPRMTTRLSVRERVRPLDRYLLLRLLRLLAFLDAFAHRVEVGLGRDRHGRDRSATCS